MEIKQPALPRALVYAWIGLVFGLVGLEFFRPHYFLTDDTLSQFLPVLHEMGVNLREGRPFWISRWLFEGHYNLAQDPTLLCNFHPLLLVASACTAGSPFFWWIAEGAAAGQWFLAVTGFCLLALRWRSRGEVKIPDFALAFLALSSTFTVYNLWFSPSWFNFSGASFLLPWLLWAAEEPSARRSVILLSLVTLHALLSLHIQIVFYSFVFATCFGFVRQGFSVGQRLLIGGGLGSIPVIPLLWCNLQGYLTSERHALSATGEMLQGRLNPLELMVSSIGGAFRYWRGDQVTWFSTHPAHVFSIALSAAGVLALASILNWRKSMSRLDRAIGCGIVLVMLMIWRPEPVQALIQRVPVVNGFSSPFRETYAFVFFLHLWVLARYPWERVRLAWVLSVMGIGLWLASVVPYGPPAISPMVLDRQLVLDGRAAGWWRQQKQAHPEGIFIPVARPEDLVPDGVVPFSLLGSHAYACLFEFRSASGYSRTQVGGRGEGRPGAKRWLWYGVYLPADAEELCAKDPRYVIVDASYLRTSEGINLKLP